MTKTKIKDALCAVRLLRGHMGRVNDPLFQAATARYIDAIDHALQELAQEPAPVPAPEPQRTLSELEAAVVRCSIEERRVRLALQNAPRRAQLREGLQSTMELAAAVEALALAQERESLARIGGGQ